MAARIPLACPACSADRFEITRIVNDEPVAAADPRETYRTIIATCAEVRREALRVEQQRDGAWRDPQVRVTGCP